jgi:hypothetical protein
MFPLSGNFQTTLLDVRSAGRPPPDLEVVVA